MKDVVDTLWTQVNARAATGLALELVAGRVFKSARDLRVDHHLRLPFVVFAPLPAVSHDACGSARYVVREGGVDILVAVEMDGDETDAYEDASERSDELLGNLERVLIGLRAITSGTHPTGVWHWLEWSVENSGPASFAAGPAHLSTLPVWISQVRCRAKFRRTRAAA